MKASAFVLIGDFHFFILINSTNLNELKIKILERVARLMYPACECEGILLDKFKQFKFIVLIDKLKIELECSEDLEAALLYCDNKIKIAIEIIWFKFYENNITRFNIDMVILKMKKLDLTIKKLLIES